MAATENVNGIRTFTAAEDLAVYRRVKLDSNGELVYADADDIGIGITTEAADDGEHCAVKLHNHPGTRKVTCSEAVDVYDVLYGTDDGKVGDTTTSQGPGLYVALSAGSADGSVIEAIPLRLAHTGGVLFANLADSADVENTTVETAFDKSKTIDGAMLKVGDVLHIIARCYVLDNNSTDTLNLKLYIGTEEIAATGAVDVADADIGFIEAFVVIREIGASGKLSASGLVALGVPGTVTAKPFRLDEATENISGDIAIAVKATWSVAHADNEVYLEDLIVLHHRQ